MTGTTILTEAAFIALLPAGMILYLVLDRYTEPRAPVSAFEEFKVLVAFIVGIPAGLPLTLLFVIYGGDLQSLNLFEGVLWMFVLVTVANLERLVFLRFKTFSGSNGRSRKAYFYLFAFGCGNAVCIVLGAANYSLGLGASVLAAVLFTLLSIDLGLLEGWAGIRFAALHRAGERLYRIPLVEVGALVLVAPLYLGLPYEAIGSMALLAAFLTYLLMRAEEHDLRPLLKSSPPSTGEPKPFGRPETGEEPSSD